MERLLEARKKTEKSLLSSALSQGHKMSEILNILTVNRRVPSDPFRNQCLLGSSEDGFSDSSKAIATSTGRNHVFLYF